MYNDDQLIGYYVLKWYRNEEGMLLGHIVDFLVSNESYLNDLFYHAINRLNAKNPDIITLWCNQDILLGCAPIAVKSLIQEDIMPRTHFGFKIISNRLRPYHIDFLNNFENWDLRMADSDTF